MTPVEKLMAERVLSGRRRITAAKASRYARRALLHIGLAIVAFINLYPFLWMIGSSLKDLPEFAKGGFGLIPEKIHLENYVTAWREAEFGRFFFNTLFIATVPTVTNLLTAAMAGYALSKRGFPGRQIWLVGLLVMMFIPGGFSIIPVFEIIWKLGLLHSMMGVILPGMVGGGMTALLFMGYYRSTSAGVAVLDDAAKIDGANMFQTFWNIMIPLASPMFAVLGVMGFIGGWNSFVWPLIVSLGNPKLQTLTVGLYVFRSEQVTEWTLLMAGTTIAFAPIIVLFFIAQRWIIEGIAGAIKM